MTTPMLKITNLKASYGAIEALHNISLTISAGEIVALIGNNGAGKTTLLKSISGLLTPAAGKITFCETDLTVLPSSSIVQLGISHAPEGRQIFEDFTVRENLLIGGYTIKDKEKIAKQIQFFYEIFPILEERQNQKAKLLSGGEQQMLTIARALMSSPKLLLLDEPSLGLSPAMIKRVYHIIEKVRRETHTTILLVEQNAKQALKIADRVYIIANGNILKSGTPDELLSDTSIQEAYLGASVQNKGGTL